MSPDERAKNLLQFVRLGKLPSDLQREIQRFYIDNAHVFDWRFCVFLCENHQFLCVKWLGCADLETVRMNLEEFFFQTEELDGASKDALVVDMEVDSPEREVPFKVVQKILFEMEPE